MRVALLTMLLALGWARAAVAEELRFAVGQTWAPPFIKLVDGRLQGGLMHELMEQIAANAGAQARYLLLPSKRVDAAMLEGQVDLHCMMNPAWFAGPIASERWSVPLLRMEDWLTGAPGSAAAPLDLEAQRQMVIGLVLGYSYPTIEPYLRKGQLLREDAPTQDRLLEKLALGRTPYAVVNRLVVSDYNRGRPAAQQLVLLQQIDSFSTYCLLAPTTGIAGPRILAAVRKLVDSGQLKAILARYR